MKNITITTILSIIILMIVTPTITVAQPAGPGDGTDPFPAAPVNGGVAFVAVIAFMYGAYRVYQLSKKSSTGNID